MTRPREPDLRLLCERCGYHLKGLKRTDNCPECGTPVAESLPERRIGSEWQRHPGIRTWGHVASRIDPLRRFDWHLVRVDRHRCLALLLVNCAAAGVVHAFFVLLVLWIKTQGGPLSSPRLLLFALGFVIATGLIYLGLSAIEALGMRFIAGRRGWRDHAGIRYAVIAHASYAWILCSFTIWAGCFAGAAFAYMSDIAFSLWVFGGFLLGLIVFETHIYIGMRRLRYANPPGAERELAPIEDPTVTAACAAGP